MATRASARSGAAASGLVGGVGDGSRPARRHRSVGTLGLLLGAGLVANAAVGPLGAGLVDFDLDESLTNQLLGLEVVTLVLVVPALVVAGVLCRRGRPAGPVLLVGPAGYAAYMLVQYLLGPGYLRYEPVILLQLGLLVASVVLVARAWALALDGPLPGLDPAAARRRAVVLLGLAGFVVLRYLPGLLAAVTSGPLPEEFTRSPGFYWSIWVLDLGLVVPATVAAAVGVRRGDRSGELATYAVFGWFALVPPSVAAMALVMLARGDPNASAGTASLLSVAAVVFAGLAVWVLRPLLARRARVR